MGKPKIRFKGYTEDWEQRKVSEVADICAGGTPSTKIEKYWFPKEIPWLSSGEVHKKYITYTDNKISVDGLNNSSARMIPENSVLIALAGQGKTRGTVAINRIPLTTNQSIAAMTFSEEIVPEFVFCNLENRYEEIRRMSSGDGSRGGLNKQLVGEIEIPHTSRDEQQKIGAYFSNLDHLITLHQRKCDETKKLKKCMLQKMFPRDGEKVPEIRFSGFTGDWKQRKLSEFGIATGGTSIESEFSKDGIYKVINIGSYSEDGVYRDQGIRAIESEKTLNRLLNKGDIAMILNDKTSSGNIIGRVILIEESNVYVYNQRTERIEMDNEKYDSQFIYTMLNAPEIRNKIIKQSQGNTQIYVNWSSISQLEYLLPEINEQRQLGSYFRNLDNIITFHQQKCDKLKNIKKFMLQNMFV